MNMNLNCARCKEKACYEGKNCTEISDDVKKAYKGDDLKSVKISAHIESSYYMRKTRIEELILYANEMGYKKLGVAFCIGLEKEAEIICEILSHSFDVSSVCCKVCGIDKSYFGLERLHKDKNKEVEAMCNPIGLAMILNKEKTDLNICLGLCIGHDILFTKYSEAPVTTLAVKDRVLAHNPLGAIYSGYYLKKIGSKGKGTGKGKGAGEDKK
jgi:uncharacterized metal-binding protein